MKPHRFISIAIVLVLCVFLVSCRASDSIPSDNPQQNFAADSSDAATSTEPLSMEYSKTTLAPDAAQIIDTAPLYFTRTLGVRKRYENSLPVLVGFEYPYLFYERMSVVVEGASKNDASLYVGRYSIETSERVEIPLDDFDALSNEARLVVNERFIVYMVYASDENGQPSMNITLFDMEEGTQEILCSYPVRNVFGYAKILSAQQLVFMLYPYDQKNEATRQVVLTYRMDTKEIREIYQSEAMDWTDPVDSTKNIWAIDTDEGNIYLLSHQLAGGKMKTYLDVLTADGTVLDVQELGALQRFDSRDDTAETLVVQDGYLFVHYSQAFKQPGNTNPPFAILKESNAGYQLVDTNGVYPKTFCGGSAPSGQPLYFSVYPGSETTTAKDAKRILFTFDTANGSATLVDLALEGVEDFLGDSSGNLVVHTRGEDNVSRWRFIPKAAIDLSLP